MITLAKIDWTAVPASNGGYLTINLKERDEPMAGYNILVGETRPVLDQNGDPIASATQAGLPLGPGLAATMFDQGGNLVCSGNFPGVVPFILAGGGGTVQHEVTVLNAPFDWELGEPL